MEGTSLLSPEEVVDLVWRLTSVDPGKETPDGYDGQVLDAVLELIKQPGESFSDHQVLAMVHHLINHWSEVVDL